MIYTHGCMDVFIHIREREREKVHIYIHPFTHEEGEKGRVQATEREKERKRISLIFKQICPFSHTHTHTHTHTHQVDEGVLIAVVNAMQKFLTSEAIIIAGCDLLARLSKNEGLPPLTSLTLSYYRCCISACLRACPSTRPPLQERRSTVTCPRLQTCPTHACVCVAIGVC